MKLKNVLLAGVASSVLLSGSVFAASWNVSPFDATAYDTVVANGGAIEDFEGYAAGQWSASTITQVGTFSASGGTGSGSTCTTLNGDCTQLFLSETAVNGQGNITPDTGLKALQANDTFGMVWNAALNGNPFSDILFGIRDAADQGAIVTISLTALDGVAIVPITTTLQNLANGAQSLVSIALAKTVESATISIISSKVNDSFTFDGGALYADNNRIGEVPLPAAAWLFLSALGGASVLRRVRGKA